MRITTEMLKGVVEATYRGRAAICDVVIYTTYMNGVFIEIIGCML